MPRKKSVVHRHFRRADNQADRRIEVVECVHCGHQTAGNNVARLLKHLQAGCWPASSPDDPALLFQNRPASHVAIENANPNTRASGGSMENENESNGRNTQIQPTIATPGTPTVAPNPRLRTPAQTSQVVEPVGPQPFLLLQVTVKDTKDPVVSRFMAVPTNFTFRHLQRALSVAFSYRTVNGMFDITYPNWIPGKGRPPRRKQICIFHDHQQKDSWHAWDEPDQADVIQDERFLDDVTLDVLIAEVKSCKIVFHVGPWAHDVDIQGETGLSSANLTSQRHAVCLAGEGHPVLESSDPMMWQAFKDAYATNTPNPTQKSYRLFYERECQYGDPRGLAGGMPWNWDKDNVNRQLKSLPAGPALSTTALRRVIHVVEDEPYEGEDQAAAAPSNNVMGHMSNHAQVGNSGYQQDEMMHSNQNRGLHHPMQHTSYPMTNHPAALEQLRYS